MLVPTHWLIRPDLGTSRLVSAFLVTYTDKVKLQKLDNIVLLFKLMLKL